MVAQMPIWTAAPVDPVSVDAQITTLLSGLTNFPSLTVVSALERASPTSFSSAFRYFQSTLGTQELLARSGQELLCY